MDVNRLSVDGKQHSPCIHAQEHGACYPADKSRFGYSLVRTKQQRIIPPADQAAGPAFAVSRKNPGKGKRVCNTDETGLREGTGTGRTGGYLSPSFLIFRLIDQFIFFDPGHHVSQLGADCFNLVS
jgi:hypothetical protein